jgi:hypothetical protein
MIIWGINALNHGNSIAVFNDGKLISNVAGSDDELPSSVIKQSLYHGGPDHI